MNLKFFVIVMMSICIVPCTVLAGSEYGNLQTEVTVYDDWPADAMMGSGSIECPGGELEWINEVTPVCLSSGRIHMRKMKIYVCMEAFTASGAPEPRLTGVSVININANLDAEYTGAVWGDYMIVPSAGCDPNDLDDPEIYWKGTWQGQRSVTCNEVACTWIGNLKFSGKGRGGDIDNKHFKGGEIITTYTPLPVPWELIPGFPVSGPEGVITGVIKE
jgi:hypothetical protein